MSVQLNGITFSNINTTDNIAGYTAKRTKSSLISNNKYSETKLSNMINAVNNGNTTWDKIAFINGVDIDWNGAVVDENVIINTTGELLSWIKNKSTFDSSVLEDYALKNYVDQQINTLVGEAPEALNTLKEISDKLNDNDDAVGSLVNQISSKADYENVYTKDEVDALIEEIEPGNSENVYTKDEVDALIGELELNGVQSSAGVQGDKGDTGVQGSAGVQGDKGDTGAQGSAGVQGDKGDAGIQGSIGVQGDKGDTGTFDDSILNDYATKEFVNSLIEDIEPGNSENVYTKDEVDALIEELNGGQGSAGVQGDKGDTGAKGDQGEQGPQGDKGDTGVQGDQGELGPQGAQGVQGATGTFDTSELENYASKTYVGEKIAEVVGAAPETLDTLKEIADKLGDNDTALGTLNTALEAKANSADVYNKTEIDNKLAEVETIKGDQGEQGPQGAQGTAGVQGDKGDTGVQGDKGDAGVQGDKGDTGTFDDSILNDYATKEYVNSLIEDIEPSNSENVYTKDEVDALIEELNAEITRLKAQIGS